MIFFEELVSNTKKVNKKIKDENVPSSFVFELYKMTPNNRSKLFLNSALCMNDEAVKPLIESKMLCRTEIDQIEKYFLTFRGIAQSISNKYGISLEKQYEDLLDRMDCESGIEGQEPFDWKEKMVSLALILVSSTSETSAIRLNNKTNKEVLGQVFQSTLGCLNKYGIVQQTKAFTITDRGESPSSSIMSRVNELPRKSNHIFSYLSNQKESGYYFNLEVNGHIDKDRLFFILGKIFESHQPSINYQELYNDLFSIGQQHYLQFINRTTNPTLTLELNQGLKNFIEDEMYRLLKKGN